MTERFQQAYRFLRHSEEISDLLSAIERNTRLLRAVRLALPPPLDDHCHHASCKDGVLTLLTDSPVWSSRLRFFAPEIAQALAPRYGPISTWRFCVRPEASTPDWAAGDARAPRLSPQTARHLMETAGAIKDAGLAGALYRLAQAGVGAVTEPERGDEECAGPRPPARTSCPR